tara:strand:- start:261 stop:380 length:120 start_codon:yes stop_codon:yes gene_type:complete
MDQVYQLVPLPQVDQVVVVVVEQAHQEVMVVAQQEIHHQ